MDYLGNEVLVQFKAGTADVNEIAELYGCDILERNAGGCHRFPGIARLHDSNRSAQDLIAQLESDDSVEYVEPNYLRYSNYSAAPDDLLYGNQWALHNTGQVINSVAGVSGSDIGWREARLLRRLDSPEVVIAVIDSGIDLNHEDLKDRLWVNPGEIAGNGIDDDNNGYVDDVHGYDFAGDYGRPADPVPFDYEDHGTHVAGIAAAGSENAMGISGTSSARIMALKVSDGSGYFANDDIVAALDYVTASVVNAGINVVAVNASYAGSGYSTIEFDAIQRLSDAGVLLIAAAGNEAVDNDQTPSYPANYSNQNIISVASTDNRDQLSSFSNYGGSSIHLAAPGSAILSTIPEFEHRTVLEGTSPIAFSEIEFSNLATEVISGAVVDCGIGNTADFPLNQSGYIALIERGTLYFSEKVDNASVAGAAGVLIYNQSIEDRPDAGDPDVAQAGWTLQSFSPDRVPAFSISRNDGLDLLARTPVVTLGSMGSKYAYFSGTSMSAPYVTGSIAVLAKSFPSDTLAQRKDRLLQAVDPLDSLSDKVVTGGRLNLYNALDADKDLVPDWYEVELTGDLSLTPQSDYDGDGLSDLNEYRVGSNPADGSSRFTLGQNHDRSNGQFIIRWPSAVGRTYDLLWASSLDEPFASIETAIAATPPVNEHDLSNHLEKPGETGSGFFRVQINWPD